MYVTAQRMRWEPRRDLAFGAISGVYAPIGNPLSHAARLIKFVNQTDADIDVSDDGVNNKDIIPAGGFALYDIMSNKSEQSGMFLDENTTIYIKGAPTSGNFYMIVIYAASF